MPITMEEIKEAACGYDSEGQSKSITVIAAHNYLMNDENAPPEVIAEFSSLEPEVSMAISNEITWISLKFASEKSSDLSLYFRTLERFLEEVEKGHMNKNSLAFLSVIPIEFAGQYYINAMHPIMWAVEPESIGADFRILRIAFFSENIAFLESNLEDGFFDEALRAAKEANEDYISATNAEEYNRLERNDAFLNSDRFFADKYEDETDDEDDYYDDNSDEYEDGNEDDGRSSYIYN